MSHYFFVNVLPSLIPKKSMKLTFLSMPYLRSNGAIGWIIADYLRFLVNFIKIMVPKQKKLFFVFHFNKFQIGNEPYVFGLDSEINTMF